MDVDQPVLKPGATPAAAPGNGTLSEEEFLRGAAVQVDHAVFLARFPNWRISMPGAVGIVWILALMFDHLEPAAQVFVWASLDTAVFVAIAAMCLAYEKRRPAAGTPAQRRWLQVWTLLAGLGGFVSAALLWFIPAHRDELQMSAAALVSILAIAFVVSRGHRPLIYAIVAGHALALCLGLALHARLYAAVPVALLFSGFVLAFGLALNGSIRAALGQRLYAQYLHGQLQRSHARELQLRQAQATLNERRRVLSDLGEGVGSQLLASLQRLESGQIPTPDAAQVLRECADDLRLLIDVHEPAARNPATLLGMLRHRLQRRIEAAGLRLQWHTDELPATDLLPSGQTLDLLRVLQEAIANVLQHAGARQISISMRRSLRQLEIAVEDDGHGFDPAAMSQGRGIAGMQRRAARLGGELTIESRDEGGAAVRLHLRLPLGGAAPAEARAG